MDAWLASWLGQSTSLASTANVPVPVPVFPSLACVRVSLIGQSLASQKHISRYLTAATTPSLLSISSIPSPSPSHPISQSRRDWTAHLCSLPSPFDVRCGRAHLFPPWSTFPDVSELHIVHFYRRPPPSTARRIRAGTLDNRSNRPDPRVEPARPAHNVGEL